ncbi:MAG: diadenylate cyclase CdaA [Clostridiales Family XIII bacterium]|nr:diadenylate cyclase CdaA [Clostridiales Family XIII bacterium]
MVQEFFDTLALQIGPTDFIDIAIIAFIIYQILRFIRETRAEQLVKGLLILIVIMVISGLLHLYALNWVLKNLMQFGMIALVIVFQPELRRALEYLGRSRFLRGRLRAGDKEKAKAAAAAVAGATGYFSTNKIGALIIVERDVTLNDFSETGVILNSDLSAAALENIFFKGAPLHDGAAIISGDKIRAAACVLPLTRSKDLPSELGMRHRAGLGITEVSDAYAIIVSEETGVISAARDGRMNRFLDVKALEKALLDIYLSDSEPISNGIFKAFEKEGGHAKKQ